MTYRKWPVKTLSSYSQEERPMGRPRKTSKPEEIVAAPYDHLYTGHDPDEERLVTTLMLAGEALAEGVQAHPQHLNTRTREHPPTFARSVDNARPAVFEEFGGLLELCGRIRAWVEEDARHAELLAQLTDAFGDGETLQLLFRNLFGEQKPRTPTDIGGKPVLTPAEVDVLRESAKDLSREEIGANLGIAPRTVGTHLHHIYKKLSVHSPMQAVAHAITMGYLDIDAIHWIVAGSKCRPRCYHLFDTALTVWERSRGWGDSQIQQALAQFGLLLLVASGMAMVLPSWEARGKAPGKSVVCALDADGRIVRSFPVDSRHLGSVVIAPPRAIRQGFTPGHLYVSMQRTHPEGLNTALIGEFSPDGRPVRCFCGGREIGTRLDWGLSLAFAADGRLLAASGTLTDAILAFSEGGQRVQRFAEGSMQQIITDASGRIYGAQYSGAGCVVKVLDGGGNLLGTIGGTPPGVAYGGLALSSTNHLFVSRVARGDSRGFIEEYDADGAYLREFTVPVAPQGFGRLCMDAKDRLYVPCRQSGDIKVLSPDGKVTRSIDLRGHVVPYDVAVGEDGVVWVCGGLA
jgi:DNA-binding CsgD family transcriptional regulator